MASVSQSVFPLFGRKSNNSSHTHRHIHTQLKGERVKKEPYHRLYNTVDGITYKYIAGWRAIEIFEDWVILCLTFAHSLALSFWFRLRLYYIGAHGSRSIRSPNLCIAQLTWSPLLVSPCLWEIEVKKSVSNYTPCQFTTGVQNVLRVCILFLQNNFNFIDYLSTHSHSPRYYN